MKRETCPNKCAKVLVAVLGLLQLLLTAFLREILKPSCFSLRETPSPLRSNCRKLCRTPSRPWTSPWPSSLIGSGGRLAKSADSQRWCFAQLAASCVGNQRFKTERNGVKWNGSLQYLWEVKLLLDRLISLISGVWSSYCKWHTSGTNARNSHNYNPSVMLYACLYISLSRPCTG